MTFTSTRSVCSATSLETILRGLAPDGGLFVPTRIPSGLFAPEKCDTLEKAERLALGAFFDDVPEAVREDAIKNLISKFPDDEHGGAVPLVDLGDYQILELFQGPTGAFKDVALAVLPPLVHQFVLAAEPAWGIWVYRALTFLVASCPCALVISVPLCYFAGIGSAARSGILIKGGDSLDALCRVKSFVLDKTGTLTTGDFSVCHAHPAAGFAEEDVLALIAGAERDSSHPLAQAAIREAEARGIAAQAVTLTFF